MLSEFDLIQQYFVTPASSDRRIALGIGDDCALLQPSPGMQLAISSDMLVSGRHFFPDADPRMLGHKCLAVNLSDLAAMGAKPVAFTLALALPEARPDWLAEFSGGLLALAEQHHCVLIGGDTTKGPLTICITIFGELPPGRALRRDAAQVGDDIWVSGTLGDARLALAHYWDEMRLSDADLAIAAPRMHQPTPRIALGTALQAIAHAALDISDGLIGDLGHILKNPVLVPACRWMICQQVWRYASKIKQGAASFVLRVVMITNYVLPPLLANVMRLRRRDATARLRSHVLAGLRLILAYACWMPAGSH